MTIREPRETWGADTVASVASMLSFSGADTVDVETSESIDILETHYNQYQNLISVVQHADTHHSIRCLVAKVGLDGHDRGAHLISRSFRDAGFEAIYSGLHQTPEELVQAAVQEDVDVVGISILSGAHNTLVPKIIDGLKAYKAFDDTLILVGGIIPEEDREGLRELGVAEVFGPGVSMEETISFIREHTPDR